MDFSSQPMSDNAWQIEAGTCYVMFAYDAARSIDLNAAEKRMQQSTQRPTLLKKRRTPSYFEYQPPAQRVSQEIEPLQVNGRRSGTSVDLMMFDFGSMAATAGTWQTCKWITRYYLRASITP